MCRSHDLHRATPTAPETQQCNVTIISSQLPGEQRITDPPRPRPVEQRLKKSSDLGGLGKLPLWRFFLIYLYTHTCPRAFSVHFLQASIIAKFVYKVLKRNVKKKFMTPKNFNKKIC